MGPAGIGVSPARRAILGFQQPDSVYGFFDALEGCKRFLSVLNTKKAKLRELRDKEDSGRAVEEEESTDKAESFESGRSDNEQSEEEASKKATASSKARGRKRVARS